LLHCCIGRSGDQGARPVTRVLYLLHVATAGAGG